MTMLTSARRTLHPAAETALRFNFGLHHPDTKPLLAMIPASGDLPSLVTLLESAARSVLDGLDRIAKLCIRSGTTALELFQKDCSFERMPDDTDVVEAVLPIHPQSARKMPVIDENGDERHDLVLSHQIRPDLATLMSFMRRKAAEEKSQGQRKYTGLFNRLLPGKYPALSKSRCL